jgi:nucleotide-binding universal stress UspA family protein
MSATRALFVVLAVWLLIGVVAAVVMRRRGHHLFGWGALGVLLGPLVIPLALSSVRSELPAERVIEAGDRGGGPIDVLIAVDGSPEAAAAMYVAVELFAGRLGNVALAVVPDYETFGSTVRWDERDEVLRELERDAVEISRRSGRRPEAVLLAGVPAEALQRYALEHEFNVVVAGRRGHGASGALLGSVASRLARESRLPVLLAGPASPEAA